MILFGKRCELFVDNYLIESKEGIRFRSAEPQCVKKVLTFDKPWEAAGSLGLTVFRDHENIKMYYRGFPGMGKGDGDEMQTSCLAVSEDGLNFELVAVNEIDYNGIKENNIVFIGTNAHNFAPFYDENPNCKPEERYKAIGGIKHVAGKGEGGLSVYCSPDGIHWRDMLGHPAMTEGTFDSMNIAFYDKSAEMYRCYSRNESACDDPTVKTDFSYGGYGMRAGLRAIQSYVSTDFLHWSRPVMNEYDVGDIDQLYTNAASQIPGAEHILISIPMRFEANRRFVPQDGNEEDCSPYPGISDSVLMTSRDGMHWNKTLRDAWIRPNLALREWTQRNFIALAGVIESGDDFLVYIEKHYMWDDGGIYAYRLPRHRFISVYADNDGGSITTKPMVFESEDIYLNYSTSAYGYVKLRILNDAGEELFASGEIFGNELNRKLHIDGIVGKCGRILLEMKEADVYAIGASSK